MSTAMAEEARVKPERARLFPKLDPARWYEVRRHEGSGFYIWEGARELFVIGQHFDLRERTEDRSLFDF